MHLLGYIVLLHGAFGFTLRYDLMCYVEIHVKDCKLERSNVGIAIAVPSISTPRASTRLTRPRVLGLLGDDDAHA